MTLARRCIRLILRFSLWLADAEILCSRCLRPVPHSRAPTPDHMTAGYYVVDQYWQSFCNPGEVFICDACMWADPRYRAIYGIVGGTPDAAGQ